MSETLEIDKPYIESKVNDWVRKVEELYLLVKNSLVNNKQIECKSIDNMVMREELMQKYGVPPKNVPIFDLYKDKKLIATFRPVGLWVIGAKGRIDILTKTGAFILVNISENESQPEWKVFAPKNRKKGENFNAAFIDKLVNAL